MVSARDFRSPLSAAYRWNEEKAAECFRDLRKEKNHVRRGELRRDGNRYTRNAISIHHRQWSV